MVLAREHHFEFGPRGMFVRFRIVLTSGLVLIVAALSAWLFLLHRRNTVPPQTITIGFRDARPYNFPDANGDATGPAVDLIKAAARRKHIDLRWKYLQEGPDQALLSGAVDLWPTFGDTPERRKSFYVTDPWLKFTFVLVFPESAGLSGVNEFYGQSLAVSTAAINQVFAREHFPHSAIVSRRTPEEVVEAVCSGVVDGALLAQSSLSGPTSECAQNRLTALPIPGGTFWFGLGADKRRAESCRVADLLRDEIGAMAKDG